jgi:hypothetical protein
MEIQDWKLEKAVHDFTCEMKLRLAEKEQMGYGGWNGPNIGGIVVDNLTSHIFMDAEELAKKPSRKLCIDIANRCMMVFHQLNR